MIKVRYDMTGQRYGKLTVLHQVEDWMNTNGNQSRPLWKCQCDCGNTICCLRDHLISGRTTSCRHCGYLWDVEINAWSNKYDLSNPDYVIGYTSTNQPFYFDHSDFELVRNRLWMIDSCGYVNCGTNSIRMHRMIMGTTDSKQVIDHINHNRVDNRRSNLRLCTQLENTRNQVPSKRNRSGYVGVYWAKDRQKWTAQITVNGKTKFIGRFTDIQDAINARKQAEVKYW